MDIVKIWDKLFYPQRIADSEIAKGLWQKPNIIPQKADYVIARTALDECVIAYRVGTRPWISPLYDTPVKPIAVLPMSRIPESLWRKHRVGFCKQNPTSGKWVRIKDII